MQEVLDLGIQLKETNSWELESGGSGFPIQACLGPNYGQRNTPTTDPQNN